MPHTGLFIDIGFWILEALFSTWICMCICMRLIVIPKLAHEKVPLASLDHWCQAVSYGLALQHSQA